MTRLENGEILNFSSSYFSDLKEAHPENPIALFFYAVQMLYEEEEEKAIDLLNTSTEIEPGNQSTWLFLGYAYDRVGMVMHARDAYTKTLILNPDNEAAYENLASISWRDGWESNGFCGLDFSLQHFRGQRFLKIGETSKTSGMLQSENPNVDLFIQITWQPDGGDSSQEHLQQQMVSALDVGSPGFKTVFKPYNYSSIPMTYRNYAYRLPGSSSFADAVLVGAQCNSINYVIDFRFVVDGEEHDWLHHLLTICLETFSCEIN